MRCTQRSDYSLGSAAIALAACAFLTGPAHAVPDDPPEYIELTGTVRDFRKSHPDFNVSDTGHVPNNSAHTTSNFRPQYLGAGFEVATQWKNEAGDNIPPHLSLYGFGGLGVIPVTNESNEPTGGQGEFDTYDSSAGPYGGDNVGPPPVYQVGAPMPAVIVPAWLMALPNLGDRTLSGTNVMTQSAHFNTLTIAGTLKINGNVSIVCEGKFRLATQGKIELMPGATLDLYLVQGADEIAGADQWNHVQIGDPLDPSRVRIYNLSSSDIMIHNHAQVWAVIISPYAKLSLVNHGELFGLFVGLEVFFGNHGKLHLDNNALPELCSTTIDDQIGIPASLSDGRITSQETFNQWYSDHLGVNMAFPHTITLHRTPSGMYEYNDNAFFPIDNQLYGNEGASHNYNFTFSFAASFVHDRCQGQFIEFHGADDVWVYINNTLAMDLGGVMALTPQVAELDRLGLIDGQTYHLRFYYAQRNPDVSVFRLRTNIELESTGPVSATAVYD